MSLPEERPPTGLTVLADANVRRFIFSRFCSGAALTLLRAAIAWQLYEISGSPLSLGIMGLVQFVPTLILSLPAGAVADSYDRRRVVVATQVAALATSSLLAWLTFQDAVTLPVIYAALVATAAASSFENPSGASLLPMLVPRDLFPSATALLSSARNFSWVTGPVVAGFVMQEYGAGGAYLLHAGLLVVSAIGIAGLRTLEAPAAPRGVSVAAIREGIAFVRSRPAILGAMTLDMLAVIFGAAEALLPVFAKDVLQVGPAGYGLLSASFQVGTFAMALLLVVRPPLHRAGRALLLAVGAYALATVAFGLSRVFWLSLLCYGSAGVSDQISMVARSTIIQLSTPDELRGRVNSVNFVFIGASNHLGAMEAGFVAALFSAPFAVVTGGLAALAIAGWMAWRNPALRRYDMRDAETG